MPTANDTYYKRDDVIQALAEYLMDEAQTEWAGTASEDIEDWEDLAEMILRDVPSVTGALMRAEAYAEGIKAEQERMAKKGSRR